LAEQTALTLNHLGLLCYSVVGRFADCEVVLLEAATIWRQLDNLPMLSLSLASLSLFCIVMGKYQQANSVSAEAFQIAQSLNNPWSQAFNNRHDGYVHWERGDVDRACQSMAEGLPLAEQARYVMMQFEMYASLTNFFSELGAYQRSWTMASVMVAILKVNDQNVFVPLIRFIVAKVLAQLYLRQHQLAEAEHILAAECTNPVLKAMPGYMAWHEVDLVRAELAFQQEAYERALSLIEQHLANLRQFGIRSRLPYALHMQGKIHLALGDRAAAHAAWQAARAEAEALGSRWALWQILAALAQIEEDADQAAQLRQEAQVIITYIAEHISDTELRASFLSLPAVCTVAAPGRNNTCF
jgi:tetratricopeptide (TPR) repeat protein